MRRESCQIILLNSISGLCLAAAAWSWLPADFHVLRRGIDPPAGCGEKVTRLLLNFIKPDLRAGSRLPTDFHALRGDRRRMGWLRVLVSWWLFLLHHEDTKRRLETGVTLLSLLLFSR